MHVVNSTVCFENNCSDINKHAGLYTDEDECQNGTHNCDVNAKCHNSIGSFTCSCLPGYLGDGVQCSGECECLGTVNIY